MTAQRTLRRVGFFRELAHGDPDGPSVREVAERGAYDDQAALLRYLRGGTLLVATPGVVDDVLADSPMVIGPPHLYTDGVYVWPADLPYYVEHYRVALPAGFLDAVAARGYRPPAEDELDLGALAL
jgi:hypothetical protein